MPIATLSVRGKSSEWAVSGEMRQEQIDAMVEDGIEVGIVQNTIPMWVVECGLLRPWCFLQDLWNFKNPVR